MNPAPVTTGLRPFLPLQATRWWHITFWTSFLFFACGLWAAYHTFIYGVGTWGNNNTVGWGLGITNFVWWIGIGHAGTFISAVLLLFRQKWRTGKPMSKRDLKRVEC